MDTQHPLKDQTQLWVHLLSLLRNEPSQEDPRQPLARLKPVSGRRVPTAVPSRPSPGARCPGSGRQGQRSPVPAARGRGVPRPGNCGRESSWSLADYPREPLQKSYTKYISVIKIYFSPFLFNYGKRWIACLIWQIKKTTLCAFITKIIHIFIIISNRK